MTDTAAARNGKSSLNWHLVRAHLSVRVFMHVCRGHLDPHAPQSNITFAQTIARDKPDIIAIQIGENDVMQQPTRGENVSYYTEVLREQVVKVAKASGAKVYLATISVIGEEVNNTNHAKIITCTRSALCLNRQICLVPTLHASHT